MPLPGKPPACLASSAAAALALTVVAAPAAAATVVLDTFGAGNAYSNAGWGWVGPGPTGVVELGFVFTAPVSATIGALTVPLSLQAPPSPPRNRPRPRCRSLVRWACSSPRSQASA